MVAWLIAAVVFAHGVGHSMGIVQATNLATINPAWSGDSWILTGTLGTGATRFVGIVLWSVALVGFVAVAATVAGWLPAAWFGPLAVVSAVASLAGLALFPIAFPTFSTIGALAIDVAVLIAVVVWHWEPGQVLG
jgi:hypothetical protein